jgi:hypothetical protein
MDIVCQARPHHQGRVGRLGRLFFAQYIYLRSIFFLNDTQNLKYLVRYAGRLNSLKNAAKSAGEKNW